MCGEGVWRGCVERVCGICALVCGVCALVCGEGVGCVWGECMHWCVGGCVRCVYGVCVCTVCGEGV